MSVAKAIRDEGLKGLSQVSEITNVIPHTIRNWHETRPELFEIVILGVKSKLKIEADESTYEYMKNKMLEELKKEGKI